MSPPIFARRPLIFYTVINLILSLISVYYVSYIPNYKIGDSKSNNWNTSSSPYPIYATDTYIHKYTFLARSRSVKSSYEAERYRRYTGDSTF